jgi:hypothetical protein
MPDGLVIVKFRRNTASVIAALLAVVPAMLFCVYAMPSWLALLPMVALPVVIAVWSWRSGTDARTDGLVIRTLPGRRHLRWTGLSGVVAEAGGRVSARLTSGTAVHLPAVATRDVPTLEALASMSGHDAAASLQDLPARVVRRNDWRLVPLLVSVYLAFGLADWSARYERLVPTHMISDVPTVRLLPAGGWPFAFLYDSPCCSVIGSLGLEDTFKPGWFLLDAAVFGVLPATVAAVLLRRPRRRSHRRVDRSTVDLLFDLTHWD